MKKKHSGQVGLVVLLVMVVVLTLGISIVSRSSLDVVQSRQEEETSRVFDAAEAGIEDALSQTFAALPPGSFTGNVGSISDINVEYTIDQLNTLEVNVPQGHTVAVDLTGAVGGEQITIEWARNQTCAGSAAAVVVALINDDGAGNITVRRSGVTPTGCVRGDNFVEAGGAGSDGYIASNTFTLAANDKLARIRPIYNDSYIRVTAPGWASFPIQQYKIHSEADSQIGGEVRAVEVDRTIPAAPSIFDYVLFSGTTIVK